MKRLLAALFTILIISACSTPEPPVTPIQLDFTALSPILLNTRDLRVIDRSQTAVHAHPYIGNQFSPTVAETVQKMISQRIKAEGNVGHATLIIKESNVIARPLAMAGELFTREQAWEYEGRAEITLETQSPIYGNLAKTTAAAVHKITLPEDPTPYEKQEAYRSLLTKLMNRLNENLDQGVAKHLSGFLVNTTPVPPQIQQQMAPTAPTTDSLMSDPLESDQP